MLVAAGSIFPLESILILSEIETALTVLVPVPNVIPPLLLVPLNCINPIQVESIFSCNLVAAVVQDVPVPSLVSVISKEFTLESVDANLCSNI